MVIDYSAINRVLTPSVAERFGLACESFSDGADAPGMLCMALERWQADPSRSLDQHMTDLLDEWEAYQGSDDSSSAVLDG